MITRQSVKGRLGVVGFRPLRLSQNYGYFVRSQLRPLIWYRLRETAGSTAVNAITPGTLNATISGATVGQAGPNGANEAYDFDGADDLLTVTNQASIQALSPFTILIVHYPRTAGELNAGILHIKDGTGGSENDIFRLDTQNYFCRADFTTTNAFAATNTSPITLNAWQSSALRLNADLTLDILHNGVNLALSTDTQGVGTRPATTNAINIGSFAGSQAYDGYIAEYILTNTALTNAQILDWHNLTGV